MARQCYFTGKRRGIGYNLARSGAAIQKGGFGLQLSGRTKRTFEPNLQRVYAMVDGKPQRVLASTRAIRSGKVVKPLKRKYGYTRQQRQANEQG